jgi:hypothetical protein
VSVRDATVEGMIGSGKSRTAAVHARDRVDGLFPGSD